MIYAILILLAIFGMVWVGNICYKSGKEDRTRMENGEIIRLKNYITELRIEKNVAKREKEKWEVRFDEMEIRWRVSKERQQQLRLEKLELEAALSDALSKIAE